MPATHKMANEVIDSIIANHASMWLGACSTMPTKSSNGTEPVGGSYGRVEIDMDAVFPAAASSETSSDELISFPTSTAPWGPIVGYALWDDPTAGDVLLWYPLPEPITVPDNQAVTFPISNLKLRNP